MDFYKFFVSATRRRGDIKIPLSNIVSNEHGRTQKCNFPGFIYPPREFGAKKHFTDLIQYNVSEIQFWSVKCVTIIAGYAKISSNISLLPIQATQAIRMDRLDENTPLPNAFKRI